MAVTVGILTASLALRSELGGQPALVIFTIAIMASAYVGGLRGGLISTVLSLVLGTYYLLPPLHSFAVASAVQRWQQVLIVLAGVIISLLNESLHRAQRASRASSAAHLTSEAVLRDAESRHRALIDWSPEAVVVHVAGEIAFVNPAAAALLGARNAMELVGKPLIDLVHPDSRSLVLGRLDQARRDGLPLPRIEETLLTLGGEAFHAEAQSLPIIYEGRQAILTSLHDTTERHIHTAEIARLNSLYAALSHISSAVARTTDRSSLFLRICEALVKEAGFRGASIYWYDAESRVLAPVAESGDVDGIGEGLSTGAAATAFHEDLPVIEREGVTEKKVSPVAHAIAAFPIRVSGAPCAVLSVYAGHPDHFGELELALLEEAAGEVSFALENFARDTLQDHAEHMARTERTFSDAIFEGMPGILILYDAAGRIVRWNREFENVSGYSPDEILSQRPLDLFEPESRERVGISIANIFEHGEATVEAEFMARDGNRTPYYMSGKRVMVNGEPHLVAMGIDISERKHLENLLRASERGLVTAQRVAHLGSWEMEIATGELFWSDEIYRIFGVDPAAFGPSYETFLAAVHPDDRDRVSHAVALAPDSDVPYEIEHRVIRPDGTIRWVHELGEIQRDPLGRPARMVGTVHDITDLHESMDRLRIASETLEIKVAERTEELQAATIRAEAADRTKSAFLATMSHELRTPLNSILGFTGIVLKEMAGPLTEEQARQLGMVRGSARHLLELINDVLDISKIEAGQLDVHPDPFDLLESIERVFGTVATMAEQKGVSMLLSVPPSVGEFVSDRRRVEQILLNLLGNAIKFTERGSVKLSVSCVRDGFPDRRPSDAIRFTVSDTGVGISPEDVTTLFEPFRQIDGGLTRHNEGTGLGLAISRRLATLLGGDIAVASTLGAGSSFSLTLPARPFQIS